MPKCSLEDRQVVRRGLDRNLEAWRPPFPIAVGSGFEAEDGLELGHLQPRAGPIDDPLKDLLEGPARVKQEVATGFDLIHGVVVAKPALLLLVEIQRETETRAIDPALTHLAQAPYRLGLRQGLCDRGQVGRRGDRGETVALLGEYDPAGRSVRGDVLMPIEHDLGAERRMAGHLDREMPPLGVHDVEGIVVHERSLRREVSDDTATGPADLPDGGIRATDQDEKQPELSARTLCTFRREFSLFRRQGAPNGQRP